MSMATETDLWSELLENFKKGLTNSIEKVKERDVETIPGAKDQLIRRFEEMIRYLPRNHGELLVKSIDISIQRSFFPRTSSLAEAFAKILASLEQQYENSYVINELINGFVASQSKSFGSFKEGPIIDKIVEAFKKSKNFRISDRSFYAMFTRNPDKPRKTIVKQLEKKLIVSSQAAYGEPFYFPECMKVMVQSVIDGGASALRLAGEQHINKIRSMTALPIIGITKPDIIPENFKELVYITPTFEDAKKIKKAGCDIIALDATNRKRPAESLEEMINLIHSELNLPVMADISTFEEGLQAEQLGADIISTTLAGYTTYSNATDGPDFNLLEKLVSKVSVPVILEGRVETTDHVKQAFKIGAFAIVIGSAITRPHLITRKFVEAIES